MKAPKLLFYYVTEDLHNEKQRNELEFLQQIGRVVMVSTRHAGRNRFGLKQVGLQAVDSFLSRLFNVWIRLALMLGRLAESRMDHEFPIRNVYLDSKLLTSVVNGLWRVKRLPALNRLLPTYDRLFFAPFAFGARRSQRCGSRYARIVVHDALLVQVRSFAAFIHRMRLDGVATVGVVKSWDNPFYSQLALATDGYFVWSASMQDDVLRTHSKCAAQWFHAWGARPFLGFLDALKQQKIYPRQRSQDQVVIGYAAAFCEPLMVAHEVDVLCGIAEALQRSCPQAHIRIRPYPTIDCGLYDALTSRANVSIVQIGGELVDRFGDGREMIRFGSNEERIEYLAGCDVFLSLGTSFTIEAAMFGLPIFHYFPSAEHRSETAQWELFRRVEISDHLMRYFAGELVCFESHDQLIGMLQSHDSAATAIARGRSLLRLLGVPARDTDDSIRHPPATIATDLLRLANKLA
jgi:hypothetical protein